METSTGLQVLSTQSVGMSTLDRPLILPILVLPIVFAISLTLGVAALAATWRLHRRYGQWLAERRSDSLDFKPVWLVHLLIAVAGFGLLSAIEYLLGALYGFGYYDRYWVDFAAMCVVFFIAVEALVHMQRAYPKMPGSVSASIPAPEPAAPSSPRDWDAEAARLHRAIEVERWYLEPGLSLRTVAERIGSNQTYVSRALNQGRSKNFSQFVNGLRVAHAQRLIAERDASLVDLALESGFGSKASFNRAFREQTGMTPSSWRARQAPGKVSNPVND
jgi:AraC-like DNA-binding protein